jgi:hypothetical protein
MSEKEVKIPLNLTDKPHLLNAIKTDKVLAKEVMETFAELMNEAFDPEKGIAWAYLPKKFNEGLTFRDLIKGILRGSLDLKSINPDAYDAIKEEVHPLSMLTPRWNYLENKFSYTNWRSHFRQPKDAVVDCETIANIFRKMLRYTKYVKIDELAWALVNKQIATFEGLGERNVENLPFVPALRYQQNLKGDLYVGTFLDDIGFFDCGSWLQGNDTQCPSCNHPESIVSIGTKYKGCLDCNAGFVEDSI